MLNVEQIEKYFRSWNVIFSSCPGSEKQTGRKFSNLLAQVQTMACDWTVVTFLNGWWAILETIDWLITKKWELIFKNF